MAKTGKRLRREDFTVQAVDPSTGKMMDVRLSEARVAAAAKRGMNHAKEAAFTVPDILVNPRAIFEGLLRDEDEPRQGEPGWLCYVGLPKYAFGPNGEERPPYKEKVYLVFVNHERVAYNWYWSDADGTDPNLPIDHAERFRERNL